MSVDLIIHGGRVVTPSGIVEADIAIAGGRVRALGDHRYMPAAKRALDATGLHVLPGIVDPHAHLGYTDTLEFVESETRAAACGGVTTLGIYLLALREGVLKQFDGFRSRFESLSSVDAFFHLMVIDELTTREIVRCPEIGINSFKFNMGYKGPHADLLGISATDDGATFRGFRTIGGMAPPARAAVHAENIDIHLMLREELMAVGRRDFRVWNESRPPFVEAECMRRAIYLAKSAGCRLYFPHITIAEGVDIVAEARAAGLDVVGETCPQYLTHNNDDPAPVMLDHPACGNVNPPLRDRTANARLWQGIAQGVIQTIGSDLAPTTLAMKGDDIWQAPMGLANNSELLLPVMLSEGVNKGRISLEKLVEVCAWNPARVFGLFPRKGQIAVGADADLVVVDLERRRKVEAKNLESMCDWSIYDGWELTGWPTHTILRGEIVAEDGKPSSPAGVGRHLSTTPGAAARG
ncbi:MAG: amidohydrolase family protein [Gammaproteobacteria bacterium]|nr:amidohydrolase family protein [Gammaproteobacteria bacterium]